MPTSFDALHEETRPLALLDPPPAVVPCGSARRTAIAVALPLVGAFGGLLFLL